MEAHSPAHARLTWSAAEALVWPQGTALEWSPVPAQGQAEALWALLMDTEI